MKRCYTKFQKKTIDEKEATELYNKLRDNIQWQDGIRSKKGYTRKAYPLDIGDVPDIDTVIYKVLSKITDTKYMIDGIYLNYYENGDMWTPNHSHKGTHQLVISLGATRTLELAKKSYQMSNGDAIIFGSGVHGVPKDNNVIGGRISIATFMTPIENIPNNSLQIQLPYNSPQQMQLAQGSVLVLRRTEIIGVRDVITGEDLQKLLLHMFDNNNNNDKHNK